MSNYLNQIESDLYKLNSITNGSGEVVEMVAELKEKYEKAKAWDRVYEAFEKAENEHDFPNGVCTIMNEYESGGYNA